MDDNLRCSSTRERNDRTAQRHCLDHHHTERLLPFNGIQKALSAAEQPDLLFHIDWPDVLHLIIINHRLDHIIEVADRLLLVTIDGTGKHNFYPGSLRCLNRQVCPFIRDKPSQPHKKIPPSLSGWDILLHWQPVVDNSYKVEGVRYLFTSALANGNHGQ